jgi:hypothetical protein
VDPINYTRIPKEVSPDNKQVRADEVQKGDRVQKEQLSFFILLLCSLL